MSGTLSLTLRDGRRVLVSGCTFDESLAITRLIYDPNVVSAYYDTRSDQVEAAT